VIVVDSYLDLVARRESLPPTHPTAHEIDAETGGSVTALEERTVSVPGLVTLVRQGAKLTVIWSTSSSEEREFVGATCDRTANASVLAQLANALGTPVSGWVTQNKHGHDLWDRGRAIMAGKTPGVEVTFRPGAPVPSRAFCH